MAAVAAVRGVAGMTSRYPLERQTPHRSEAAIRTVGDVQTAAKPAAYFGTKDAPIDCQSHQRGLDANIAPRSITSSPEKNAWSDLAWIAQGVLWARRYGLLRYPWEPAIGPVLPCDWTCVRSLIAASAT